MNDFIKRAILSLDTLSKLKKTGMLNRKTAKIFLSSHINNNPAHLTALNQNLEIASKLFGSPFPIPDKSVNGPIGLAYSENNKIIGFYPDECHVLVSGMTGIGKTYFLLLVFSQSLKLGLKVWLFVRAKDMRGLLSIDKNTLVINFNEEKFNPLNPKPSGLIDSEYCNVFADIFIQSVHLYDGTKQFLIEHLNTLYKKHKERGSCPSMHDLFDYIRSLKIKSFPISRTASYRESLVNRLGGILSGTLGEVFDCSRGHEESLMNYNCIFEIDTLTIELQQMMLNLWATNLLYHRKNNPKDAWVLLGVDDANLIFDASLEKRPDFGIPIIHSLLSNVRKFKVNFIVCTQAPHLMGSSIHSNSAIKVMFNLTDGRDIKFLHQSFGNLSKEQKEFCYTLNKKQIVIKNSFRFAQPIIGTVPDIPEMREISDFDVMKNNELIISTFPPVVPRYKHQRSEIKTEGKVKEKPNISTVFNEDKKSEIPDKAKDVLMDIYNRPFIPSTLRTSGLGIVSAAVSNKVLKFIEKEQLVEVIKLNLTGKRGGQSTYHALTDKGFKLINKPPIKRYSGGKGEVHLFLQRYCKKYLPEIGFTDVAIEKEFCGKKIDLFAKYRELKIGIEICISTFNTEIINYQKDKDLVDFLFFVTLDKKSKLKLEAAIYQKIQRHSKINICLVHELHNTSYVSEVLNSTSDLFNNL